MTPDLQSTLDAIDEVAVHRCGHCDTPLGPEAPSKYWCDDICQDAWNEARSEALVDYREPTDLPQHVYNQVENGSPETTPTVQHVDSGAMLLAVYGMSCYELVESAWPALGGAIGTSPRPIPATPREEVRQGRGLQVGPAIVDEAVGLPYARTEIDAIANLNFTVTVATRPLTEAFRRLGETMTEFYNRAGPALRAMGDACPGHDVDIRHRALEARRNRNTGPQQSQRAPRRIDPRRSR